MDAAFQELLTKLGIGGILFAFMWLRLKRADDQVDAKDKELSEARKALQEIASETGKTLSAMEVKLGMRP